jgi:NADH-quinone oxidoreductase subunit E
MTFEPKILGFLCNWCSYAGADLAGVSRFQYPTNIRVIRVMCSARVDPVIILDAFLHGADGVFVGGCHLGDCHYISGNYYAQKKIEMTKKILDAVGIEVKRLKLEWVSASEGARFAEVITDFTNLIKKLGPSNFDDLKEELEAAKEAAMDYRLRILATKQKELMEGGNKYGEVFTKHEMDRLLDDMIKDELTIKRILSSLKKASSVKDLSLELNLSPPNVLRHVLDLKRSGLVELSEIKDSSPIYKVIE